MVRDCCLKYENTNNERVQCVVLVLFTATIIYLIMKITYDSLVKSIDQFLVGVALLWELSFWVSTGTGTLHTSSLGLVVLEDPSRIARCAAGSTQPSCSMAVCAARLKTMCSALCAVSRRKCNGDGVRKYVSTYLSRRFCTEEAVR